jgi:hypothetical protein
VESEASIFNQRRGARAGRNRIILLELYSVYKFEEDKTAKNIIVHIYISDLNTFQLFLLRKSLAWYLVRLEWEPEPEPHENDAAPQHCIAPNLGGLLEGLLACCPKNASTE